MSAGDAALRHDLQLLSDAGVIRTPVTTWPVPWGAVASATLNADEGRLDAGELAALYRMQARARRAMETGFRRGFRLSLQERERLLRDFEYTPREEAEAQGEVAWLGKRLAARLSVTSVTSPEDDQYVRLDGSYAGLVLGNWMLSAGQFDRWWGPGWNASLILGTNARPVPALALERNYADPFQLPVLRLLGPWSISTFMGILEDDRFVPNALLFGFRGTIRPTPHLEISLTRTAQWCGEGRQCNLDVFWDLLIGNDNRNPDLPIDQEPGNQLGGVDFRWSLQRYGLPLAVYGQLIGEDEANGLPSRYLGLAGAETWFAFGGRSLRTYAEVADTGAGVLDERVPDFAYNSGIYRSGYRYYDRSLGHPADNDSLVFTLGGRLVQENGRQWSALAQYARLNRVGVGPNPVAADERDYVNVEFAHERALPRGRLRVSVGYERIGALPDGSAPREGSMKGFIEWRSHP